MKKSVFIFSRVLFDTCIQYYSRGYKKELLTCSSIIILVMSEQNPLFVLHVNVRAQ